LQFEEPKPPSEQLLQKDRHHFYSLCQQNFFFDGFPYHAASPFSLWFLAISEHIAFHLSYQLMGELNKESTIP